MGGPFSGDLQAQDFLVLQPPNETHNEASQTVCDLAEREAALGDRQTTNDSRSRRLVVVSNRLGNVRDLAQAGGLAVGILDALAERGGLWLGASEGHHDSAASDEPLIHLERVGKIETAALTLPQQEYSLYYNGYANSTLCGRFSTIGSTSYSTAASFCTRTGRSMRALPRRSRACCQAMMT
ncbi:hypothetical protein [Mesorhizobium carmichaelinearum]|uniref:hypothetical protein n=1 Tax=Mesorhizobium carmichaelinearum TaxID=1208188 RepID=UPI001FCE8FA9|nr:hypothetical protein [Mesorhizobium carmichaelinearum]